MERMSQSPLRNLLSVRNFSNFCRKLRKSSKDIWIPALSADRCVEIFDNLPACPRRRAWQAKFENCPSERDALARAGRRNRSFGAGSQKDRAKIILTRLKKSYKKAGPFAKWKNPLELTVATMLSAQCTDARVNQVTQDLFKRYRTARAYAIAPLKDLEKAVYRTGYYKSKAKYLKGIGKILDEEYDGKVPEVFEDLIRLPGVSKKSACIIASKAFNRQYGVAVDTHVARVAPRLGLTKSKSRDGMAKDLEKLYKPKEYLNVNEFFITHGRAICIPKIPKCGACILQDMCPTGKKVTKEQGKNYKQSLKVC